MSHLWENRRLPLSFPFLQRLWSSQLRTNVLEHRLNGILSRTVISIRSRQVDVVRTSRRSYVSLIRKEQVIDQLIWRVLIGSISTMPTPDESGSRPALGLRSSCGFCLLNGHRGCQPRVGLFLLGYNAIFNSPLHPGSDRSRARTTRRAHIRSQHGGILLSL